MPFESVWYVESRVIYIRQWGTLTLEDAIATDAAIAQAAELAIDEIVHGIIDARDVTEIDINPKELQAAFSKLPKPTQGWVVTVPGDRVSAFMTQVMAQSQQMRQRDFHSPEEALEFLKSVDASLIDLVANPI